MSEYIDREAFIKDRRELYCANCARREGMKKGKKTMLYEIGSVACKSCGINDVIDDIEDYPAADVRENAGGEWRPYSPLTDTYECDKCGYQVIDESFCTNYCPNCGADMRKENNDTL